MKLRLDFERFVALTAALAASGCAAGASSGAKAEPGDAPLPFDTTEGPSTQIAIPEVTDSDPEPIHESEDPVATSGCDNDVGDVDCSFVNPHRFAGPMCEGSRGSCESLADGNTYRLRPAAAIAKCYERKGTAACNIGVRKQCIREGLNESCADPQFAEFCEGLVRSCQKRGRRPDFSADQCVRTLSGIGPTELEWAKGTMGSPSSEGCKLMFPVY